MHVSLSTILAALLALPAAAQENAKVWPYTYETDDLPASVTLHAPTHDGADASLTFINRVIHHSDEAFTLVWEAIEVDVLLEWNVGGSNAERVVVYPPDGYIAIPPEMDVDEDEEQTLHIFKWRGG